MAILITGGAGYIGSHTVKYLQEQGEKVVVVDNLQGGHQDSIQGTLLYTVDICDEQKLREVFRKHDLEAVMHFSASSLVGESMENPYKYYHNNVCGMLTLLKVMQESHVDVIVFSSSAAVYGEPQSIPIREEDQTDPLSPYGETKLAMEKMINWFRCAHGTRYVSLRYFNAAGADESGTIGEDHNPETHLIPQVLRVPLGFTDRVTIFGDSYPTRDGTCIRDYIHVMDLASAHHKALQYLRPGSESSIFNLGSGDGYSVKEVITTASKITGHLIPTLVQKRRPGDPAILTASSEKARSMLGWNPSRSRLEKIIEDAWNWHRKNPTGFGNRKNTAGRDNNC